MLITWNNKLEYIDKLTHKDAVRVALYSAKLVSYLAEAEDKAKIETCLQLVEKWLRDEATAEECKRVVNGGVFYVAGYAGYAAGYAGYVAGYAASAAGYANIAASYAINAIKSANLDPLETQRQILNYIRELYVASLPEELASNWLYVASL